MWLCLIILTAGFPCAVAGAGDRKESSNRPTIASEPQVERSSPGDQLRTLMKEVDEAEALYLRGVRDSKDEDRKADIERLWRDYLRKFDENSSKALDLVRDAPEPSVFAFLDWMVSNPRNVTRFQPQVKQTVELLRKSSTEDSRIGRLCLVLGHFGKWRHDPTVDFLRISAERNPDRAARARHPGPRMSPLSER